MCNTRVINYTLHLTLGNLKGQILVTHIYALKAQKAHTKVGPMHWQGSGNISCARNSEALPLPFRSIFRHTVDQWIAWALFIPSLSKFYMGSRAEFTRYLMLYRLNSYGHIRITNNRDIRNKSRKITFGAAILASVDQGAICISNAWGPIWGRIWNGRQQ